MDPDGAEIVGILHRPRRSSECDWWSECLVDVRRWVAVVHDPRLERADTPRIVSTEVLPDVDLAEYWVQRVPDVGQQRLDADALEQRLDDRPLPIGHPVATGRGDPVVDAAHGAVGRVQGRGPGPRLRDPRREPHVLADGRAGGIAHALLLENGPLPSWRGDLLRDPIAGDSHAFSLLWVDLYQPRIATMR